MSIEHAVVVEGLVKEYGLFKRVRALDQVNLRVNVGDVFALIGPNGAGKTTLMGCMLALLRPTAGSIQVLGKAPDALDVRRITGFLPERPSFESWMTAKEFLQYHHILSQRGSKCGASEINEVMEFVGLSEVASRPLAKFSRGMLQRIGLAQLLIGKPQLCFLDEPTSGMDPPGMDLVRRALIRLREEGATAIVNSHHLDEVARVCNRYAFMRKGKVEVHQEIDNVSSRVLIIRFAKQAEAPNSERIHNIADEVGAAIKQSDDFQYKLTLPSREDSSATIKKLIDNGMAVEEAFFEQSNLMDLFDE